MLGERWSTAYDASPIFTQLRVHTESLVALGRIVEYYARINSNIPPVAPYQVVIIKVLNHEAQKYFYINQESKGLFSIFVNVLVGFSASFEYLCYGCAAIVNILLFQCGDRL